MINFKLGMMVLVAALAFGTSMSGWANESEITPIVGANIVCSNGQGGAIFINTKAERLWQGDEPTDKEGLEFDITRFDRMRCPSCFNIYATVDAFGPTSDVIRYAVRGSALTPKKAKIEVGGIDESGKYEKLTEMNCITR